MISLLFSDVELEGENKVANFFDFLLNSKYTVNTSILLPRRELKAVSGEPICVSCGELPLTARCALSQSG
jgi:hypothetical protein